MNGTQTSTIHSKKTVLISSKSILKTRKAQGEECFDSHHIDDIHSSAWVQRVVGTEVAVALSCFNEMEDKLIYHSNVGLKIIFIHTKICVWAGLKSLGRFSRESFQIFIGWGGEDTHHPGSFKMFPAKNRLTKKFLSGFSASGAGRATRSRKYYNILKSIIEVHGKLYQNVVERFTYRKSARKVFEERRGEFQPAVTATISI